MVRYNQFMASLRKIFWPSRPNIRYFPYFNTHAPYFVHEISCFASVIMWFHCKNIYFWYVLHVYQNTHVKYFIHNLIFFSKVFMGFYCVFTAKTFTFSIFFIYTRILMYHSLYMKCNVLLVFSCYFTVYSMYKYVLLVHFTYIQEYTCTKLNLLNALFCYFFLYFHCVFTTETCSIGSFHIY
jgi:hypothetical protein